MATASDCSVPFVSHLLSLFLERYSKPDAVPVGQLANPVLSVLQNGGITAFKEI